MNSQVRSRAWCFTINNYSDDDSVNAFTLVEPDTEEDYLVFGYEKGEKGTPHIQGYVHFKHARSLATMNKLLPRAHLEITKGTAEQNRRYCVKEGDYIEVGQMPKQGTRSDISEVYTMIKQGKDITEIAEAHPSAAIRYQRGIQVLKDSLHKDRTEPPEVLYIYGDSGVGKTRYATSLSDSFYMKDQTMWWNGYNQQQVIIIDDFDGKWPFRDLLRLLDRYPYQGQTKGGYVKINSPKIVITADRSLEDLYEDVLTEKEQQQLLRRITRQIHLE